MYTGYEWTVRAHHFPDLYLLVCPVLMDLRSVSATVYDPPELKVASNTVRRPIVVEMSQAGKTTYFVFVHLFPWRCAASIRAAQRSSLVHYAGRMQHPIAICGDFNPTTVEEIESLQVALGRVRLGNPRMVCFPPLTDPPQQDIPLDAFYYCGGDSAESPEISAGSAPTTDSDHPPIFLEVNKGATRVGQIQGAEQFGQGEATCRKGQQLTWRAR